MEMKEGVYEDSWLHDGPDGREMGEGNRYQGRANQRWEEELKMEVSVVDNICFNPV